MVNLRYVLQFIQQEIQRVFVSTAYVQVQIEILRYAEQIRQFFWISGVLFEQRG